MVSIRSLETVARLEEEMARAGRTAEKDALRDVLEALSRPERGFLTTDEAAERLGVSVPMVKQWIGRGALGGGEIGGRCVVSAESVDRLLRVREALRAMDEEGNPTPEELAALYSRRRRLASQHGD